MARKYLITTDSDSEYIIEERGVLSRKWYALKIKPEFSPQELRIFVFTDDKGIIEGHHNEPRLTLNKIKMSGVYSEPRYGTEMLFSTGHSTGIKSMLEIKPAD
ncbi:MAG: hypothetical protein NT001_02850 [Candidatus Woesearchaeota archaeon]|nr:hypothetical protein [Candidatus Woesearchaeota archaeon]